MGNATHQIEDEGWMDDGELIDRARDGDEQAFEELVNKHSSRVLSIAARFFRQPELREDIVQEVFIKVFQSLSSFQPGAPFEPWLTRIAVNACYDQLRRAQRRKELMFSEITDQEADWLNRHYSLQSVELFEQEEQRKVAAGLAEKVLTTLVPEDRMALLLFERDGLTTAEIARALGWSRTNVKVRLFRARRALRKTIEQLVEASLAPPRREL
ncbi:MAG: sigma-70 family RNA polymerase sigma factor [Acidobacteria bacterium]|nr:sigma-70 family RNA polymerase sigma factor [Acidobacteriota bacterium]